MKGYTSLVNQLLSPDDLLKTLQPKEAGAFEAVAAIRAASDEELVGETGAPPSLVRGGLFYAHDAIDECHVIVQNEEGDLSAYWHGMVHRREGDFDNARYWFRRAGQLSFFSALHSAASAVSATMARQMNWDPYLLVGQCEQHRFGANENEEELLALQRLEFDHVFDYSWRRGSGPR